VVGTRSFGGAAGIIEWPMKTIRVLIVVSGTQNWGGKSVAWGKRISVGLGRW
jgi:hypothetical protein